MVPSLAGTPGCSASRLDATRMRRSSRVRNSWFWTSGSCDSVEKRYAASGNNQRWQMSTNVTNDPGSPEIPRKRPRRPGLDELFDTIQQVAPVLVKLRTNSVGMKLVL